MESLGLASGRDQVKLQYTMGAVDMSARKLKESTQQRSQLIGLSLCGNSGNANANTI